MCSPECRPLRRPKLGIPGFYPQGEKQREDELSQTALNSGFRLPLAVTDEGGSALKEFGQHLNTKEYSTRVNQVLETKKRSIWVQDSQKRKLPVTKENFFLVTLGRTRKEIAQSWFQDLAGNKPLSQLAKKVPVFNKKEEIFENFCERDVPIFRAVWYIKMTALYNSTIPDSKLNKKKQSNGPSFDWTLSLCHYMQERAWRASSGGSSGYSSRASVSSGTSGGAGGGPSEESLSEIHRWKYMVNLSGWLYEENLLDRHEFLRWLVADRIADHVKQADTKSLQLYLSLVLKYLLDICSCVFLSRSLITFCCQKLVSLYELNQRLQKSHMPPTALTAPSASISTPGIEIKVEPQLGVLAETNLEEDSVFNDQPSVKQDPDAKRQQLGSERKKTLSISTGSKGTNAPANGVVREGATYFSWCGHHGSLLLQLSSIVQTVATQCPTALVHCRVKGSGKDTTRGGPLLSQLPVGLAELPMPPLLEPILHKKLILVLRATEQEIQQRTKSAENGWSAFTAADLQTTSEGESVQQVLNDQLVCPSPHLLAKRESVQQVLKIIEVLDGHSFTRCRGHNPLTVLYSKLCTIQSEAEVALNDSMLTMLLCKWAVSPHRTGHHRPMVVAKLLAQRQSDLLKCEGWKEYGDLVALDEAWEETPPPPSGEIRDFPFQQALFRFLDSHAPLPGDLSAPLRSTDPFFHLVSLFSNLIQHNVFSYSLYLSLLIAKGEVRSPIIPSLPFARDGESAYHHPRPEPESELSLSIPLPMLKKPRLDLGPGGRVGESGEGGRDTPTGPGSPSNNSSFSLGHPPDGISISAINMIGGDSGSSFGCKPETTSEENVARLRQQKLDSLLTSDMSLSRLVSPLPFNPQEDAAVSPIAPVLSLLTGNSSLFMEEEQSIELSINKHSQRHLLYTAYFPLMDAHLTKQELSERSVVLCGIGKSRNKVEKIVKGIMDNVEHYFRLLQNVSSPVLPDNTGCPNLMQRFQVLPVFEQCVIATECEKRLRAIARKNRSFTNVSICSALVFVCELLEISGGISQILDLLVDIISGEIFTEEDGESQEKRELENSVITTLPLPPDLCLPVTCLLRKYLACLFLSQHDTIVVFEGLCRMLEGVKPQSKISSSQKTVFLFLHHLYSCCTFIQKTCHSLFRPLLNLLGNDMLIDSYPPTNSETPFQRTFISSQVTKPSECDIRAVCHFIRTNPYSSYPITICFFVTDVFSTVTQKNANSHTLCDLAHVCAEVSCNIGVLVNKELMGAFRALCLPQNMMKACITGFNHLTSKSNILLDPGIQSKLISFSGLLVANDCFFLHDIIAYIIQPIIKVQMTHPHGSKESKISLEFVSSLILHLLVDSYINGHHANDPALQYPVLHPPFVRHALHSRARELDFGYLISLLKILLRISHTTTSRGSTFGSVRGGMQVLVQTDTHRSTLKEVRATLETLTAQDWVREKCMQQSSRLLDQDYLGDTTLTPSQARYLLDMLCPCTPTSSLPSNGEKPPPLHTMESTSAVAHVLKNLSQWTLNNSLVHIKLHITQAVSSHTRQSLLDDLASQVIQVFEESCGSDWAQQGQTETPSDSGDGAYSPSVWLVTPLISKLQQMVLGRVLKCAGHVLGQGQWWNPDRGQEKRRSTRATSGAVPAKTGLQWQQPFLQLVLACMNAQATTHEELLGPLKSQLQSFLAAFDKDGMPMDEPSKAMLYAALKLRLSLVGSMLGTICSSDTTALDWTTLLMQLICSGAVDRQTDSSELFTNCLDMLATLLHSLPASFHICLAGSGEEGKKVYNVCIKKLKSELSGAKSSCLSEIQQLFPLAERPFEVFTVKQPALNMPKAPGEKIMGLRIQDSREISPWDIIEGVKNSGPLMLSWFGAVRMKRKPLKYIEQRRQVHFHTHQKRFGDMVGKQHFVSLPDPAPVSDSIAAGDDPAAPLETPTTATSKLPGTQLPSQPAETGQRPGGPPVAIQVPPPNNLPKPHTSAAPMIMGPRPTIRPQQAQQQMWAPRGPMQPNQQQRMQMTLRRIQKDQMEHEQQRRFIPPYGGHPMARPSHYQMVGQMQARPPQMGGYAGISAMQQQQRARLQMQMQMMTPEQRQIYIHRVRMRQQQQQQLQQQAMNQGMMGAPQYSAQYQPQHQQMPMQAVPPMPVQQQMQHGYNQQQMMVQQQQFPPQQPGAPQPMNPMQRPMY